MKQSKQEKNKISVTLIDGTINVSAELYTQLNRMFVNLTGKTTAEVLQAITELTQQAL